MICISLHAQINIGGNTTSSPSVSLEFGNENRGIILPYVISLPSVIGAVPGTFVFDNSDKKLKLKLNASNAWQDFTITTNGAASTAIQDGKTDIAGAKTIIGENPDANTTPGILVLSDTNKAMVLPKVADAHLNIINPSAGMMVYDPNTKQFAVFNGSVWSFWTGS